MVIAAVAAVAVGFLMLAITYVILPNQKPGQLPSGNPEPYVFGQIFSAATWIGIAVMISIAVVSIILIVNRIRTKKEGFSVNQDFNTKV